MLGALEAYQVLVVDSRPDRARFLLAGDLDGARFDVLNALHGAQIGVALLDLHSVL